MPDVSDSGETLLEVISPDATRKFVHVTESPFYIGRGSETGNHVQLSDRRISRQCAMIVSQGDIYRLEDRGHRQGVFINGEKVDGSGKSLEDGDVITFGLDDSYKIIFHSSKVDTAIQTMLTRIESITAGEYSSGGLGKLNLLLEAMSLMHSQLPLDSVLGTMLDHAIAITGADRGLLLEPDDSGSLRVRLARSTGGTHLSPEGLTPSQTALRQALDQKSSVITEDLNLADLKLQGAESIVAQRLRAVVAIPLYSMPRASSKDSVILQQGHFLGVVYLDSRRPAAFSKLERQILDALAVEAASILDNARLVERERQRQRIEQELTIARNIQQALLPSNFRDFPHLAVNGVNLPCLAVGGDYFDVFPITEDRTAILIADVSGKGLGAALLTTMLQGALSSLSIGAEPARVITHINRFLCSHAEVGRYATLFFCTLDRDGRVDFINAGHPSPLLIRGGEVAELSAEGCFPVGLFDDAIFDTAHATLQPDDTLVLFSDGVTEATDLNDNLFGVSRLREVLTGHPDAPLDDLRKTALAAVETFSRGTTQADDITLLLVRYRAVAMAASS